MIAGKPPGPRIGARNSLLFASGDFAFNLYWQSLTFYLLYYYTDVAHLPVAIAATIYMVGSAWDGIVDLAVGLLADRVRIGRGGFRVYLVGGAVPLGLSFVLLYAALPAGGGRIATIVTAHLAFRTIYALVNVPYSAMTARVTEDSRNRAAIAGLRMIFGTLAAIVVAIGTQPLVASFGGAADAPRGYRLVAILFAVAGTAILVSVGLGVRELIPITRSHAHHSLRVAVRTLLANRALITLLAAMMSAILGVSILDKLVLYEFKYALHDIAAGRTALAAMSVAGGMAIPLWMAIGHRLGGRFVWLASAALGLAAIGGYAAIGARGVMATQAMLVAAQIAMMGMNFAFWALLPDTIEYGERIGGLRIDATTYGIAALAQKIAIGAAAGAFGLVFRAIGYRANAGQAGTTLAGMHAILIVAPAAGFALSAMIILFNPLRRGTHARIVAELRGGVF